MRPAMKAASSFTNPMSADPRVCCQVSPMKSSPEASVTPRLWTMVPSVFLIAGISIHEKSDRYPVAQMIASMSCSVPILESDALTHGTRQSPPHGNAGTPKALSLDPMRTSRFASFRPSRESVLTFMNPTPESHQKRSLPSRRCGREGTR